MSAIVGTLLVSNLQQNTLIAYNSNVKDTKLVPNRFFPAMLCINAAYAVVRCLFGVCYVRVLCPNG